MNYKQIEAFRAVMLTGSMTAAAAQLHTSQSNVSRSIAMLQRETGLKLFERAGIRVAATPKRRRSCVRSSGHFSAWLPSTKPPRGSAPSESTD
ncbi:LysR family transcriptional regulator [Acidovorax sp. SDU_ACID1]|uniref:LysR family transcriptional regulator n=1 Tax=Acidovorax sp. SDU_ACID1 TaxID=3136632 RepID=UPI003873622A